MKTKLAIGIIALLLLSSTAYAASPTISLIINGTLVKPSVAPQIINGTTMVPLRVISESLGASVVWDGTNKRVTVTMPQKPAQSATGLSLAQLNEIGKSVGIVYVIDENGNYPSQGSGVLLGNGIFVTNDHVGSAGKGLRIDLNGKTYTTKGEYLFKDRHRDIYAVKIDAPGGVKINTVLPEVGDHVYALGFPGGKFTLSEGEVNRISNDFARVDIVHSAKQSPGSSGGLLVNSKGEAIGVSFGGFDRGVQSAIPMRDVQDALNKP